METKVYTVNSFALESQGGNPAACVLDAEGLGDKEMQRLAQKMNFSETAFLLPSKVADYKLRYFTPVSEVDLCGHATIGLFSVMRLLNFIEVGTYTIETKSGVLEVLVQEEEILLALASPEFFQEVSFGEVAPTLGVSEEALQNVHTPQVVSTGLKDLIVPIPTVRMLKELQPSMEEIKSLSWKYQMAGYHLYAMDEHGDIHTRNFAPLLGIEEEAATGTASGALAAYLVHHHVLPQDAPVTKIFYQGAFMNRPSSIKVQRILVQGEWKIYVGGFVKDLEEVVVTLP